MSAADLPEYEAILDALPDAVLVVQDRTVLWSNVAARRLFGQEALEGLSLSTILVPGEDEHLERLIALWERGIGLEGTHRIHFRGEGGGPLPTEVRLAHRPTTRGASLILSIRDARHPARVESSLGELAATAGRLDATLDFDRLIEAATPTFKALGWIVAIFQEVPEGAQVLRILAPIPEDSPVWSYIEMLETSGPFDEAQVPLVMELLRSGDARFLDDFPHRLASYGGISAPYEKLAEEAGMAYAAWVPLRVEGESARLVVVVAPDLTEYDFLVVRLFAAQLASAIRIGRLSRELVHRERLAAVGEMAAVLAHEVRNPLGVIFNVVGGLRRRSSEDPTATRLIDILDEEAQRLRRLVGDLLDYARPRQPMPVPVALDELVRQAITEVQSHPDLDRARASLSLELPQAEARARLDPDLFRQALVNVLLNAYQHSAPDAEIHLTLSNDPSGYAVRVTNDGAAIPEEDRARIFQPFFTTRSQGSGLGLAVARRILGDLGGEITLESTQPVCFRLSIPSAPDSIAP
jgi:signal transduction histidine kinase